jgi:RNA polymerase sigma factor (sigma-70 family)
LFVNIDERGEEMETEDLLVRQAAQGDRRAFERLVETYKGYVFAIVLNLIKDGHQAENVAQEVFVQVYISLPRYRHQGFRTWLGRIATNKAIDWKRKQAKIERTELPLDTVEDPASDGGSGQPDEELIRKEEFRRLRRVCEALPDKYRTVVKKYYSLGRSYSEIAAEEGIPVKTVETRLYRARKIIKERLEQEGRDNAL